MSVSFVLVKPQAAQGHRVSYGKQPNSMSSEIGKYVLLIRFVTNLFVCRTAERRRQEERTNEMAF